jgi:hypothetical protein
VNAQDGAPAVLNAPGAQLEHEEELPALKAPAGQAVQEGEPGELKLPAAQRAHAGAATPLYEPAGQRVHAAATPPGLNEPAAQGRQEEGALRKVPAGHTAAQEAVPQLL